mgnify:CR=1 FL=1
MTFGTTNLEENATVTLGDSRADDMPENELTPIYLAMQDEQRFSWTAHPSLSKRLGQGGQGVVFLRSEERRVGKECRSRWSRYH